MASLPSTNYNFISIIFFFILVKKKSSYTEDKVVLKFHTKRCFCLAHGGVRQATRPVTRQK